MQSFEQQVQNYQEQRHGKYINVPIDYAKPSGETTKIFVFFANRFDPTRPSLIFVNGGPGGHAHNMDPRFNLFDGLGYNVILFDQRGVALSHYQLKSRPKDPTFYSSENTAKDMLEIINALGIKKVSVYAESYGTVPANIFASWYPHRIQSVVFEGTVWSDFYSAYTYSDRLPKIINLKLKSIQPKPLKFFTEAQLRGQILPTTLPRLFETLLNAGGEAQLNEFVTTINSIQATNSNDFMAELQRITQSSAQVEVINNRQTFLHSELIRALGDPHQLMRLTLHTKEFLQNKIPPLSFDIASQKVTRAYSLKEYAKVIDTQYQLPTTPYQAKDYPSAQSIIYLSGTLDGATPVNWTIAHFKQLSKPRSQLVLFKGFGHSPILSALKSGQSKSITLLTDLLAVALSGKPIEHKLHTLLTNDPFLKVAIANKQKALSCESALK